MGMQQRVEILKLLYRGADIMIFDEPTAILTPQEVEELYKVMRFLREKGKTIVFITHKLKEVMEISDQVTVLRDGSVVGTIENIFHKSGRIGKNDGGPGCTFSCRKNLRLKLAGGSFMSRGLQPKLNGDFLP